MWPSIIDWVGGLWAASGIVYCMSQKDTEVMAYYLREHGVNADYYHAGKVPTIVVV